MRELNPSEARAIVGRGTCESETFSGGVVTDNGNVATASFTNGESYQLVESDNEFKSGYINVPGYQQFVVEEYPGAISSANGITDTTTTYGVNASGDVISMVGLGVPITDVPQDTSGVAETGVICTDGNDVPWGLTAQGVGVAVADGAVGNSEAAWVAVGALVLTGIAYYFGIPVQPGFAAYGYTAGVPGNPVFGADGEFYGFMGHYETAAAESYFGSSNASDAVITGYDDGSGLYSGNYGYDPGAYGTYSGSGGGGGTGEYA